MGMLDQGWIRCVGGKTRCRIHNNITPRDPKISHHDRSQASPYCSWFGRGNWLTRKSIITSFTISLARCDSRMISNRLAQMNPEARDSRMNHISRLTSDIVKLAIYPESVTLSATPMTTEVGYPLACWHQDIKTITTTCKMFPPPCSPLHGGIEAQFCCTCQIQFSK
jgi:hypothetical protein